ncbi:hypothetical protein QZH41_007675 [Actinostola sp. cb2023]|nr:hypothetical protein QZH41_007675 [Actinostola sp. cb2023]
MNQFSDMDTTFDLRTRSKASNSSSTPKRMSSRGTRLSRVKNSTNVLDIEAYIKDELHRLNYHPETTRHDRYIVHKHAFNQLVEDKAVVYKPILSTIKAEFEDCIDALEKGQSQAIYLQGMVKALLVEKSTLTQFVRRGDELEEKLEKLRKLNLALKTKATKKTLGKPDQDMHLQNVVAKTLSDYGKKKYGKSRNALQQFVSFDDDDPIKKKEAERIIEYCDHFNNLFDFGQYEAAAIHAANSPFGILRTYETLIRFKQADPIDDGRKPLLIFCEALMETACAAQPLTQAMSVECIKCALMEDRLDLATHWLAQGKMSYSIPLGEVLFEHLYIWTPISATIFRQAKLLIVRYTHCHPEIRTSHIDRQGCKESLNLSLRTVPYLGRGRRRQGKQKGRKGKRKKERNGGCMEERDGGRKGGG